MLVSAMTYHLENEIYSATRMPYFGTYRGMRIPPDAFEKKITLFGTVLMGTFT